MEIKKSRHTIHYPAGMQTGRIFVDSDMIVPDAKPDVLKIIQVDGDAVVLQKDIAEGKLILKGKIDYKILYIPDTGSGVKGINGSTHFTHTEEMEGNEEDLDVDVMADLQHLEFHLVNSRKIAIKSIVEANIQMKGQKEIEYITDVEDNHVETKYKTLTVSGECARKIDEIHLSARLELPEGKPAIGNILKTDIHLGEKDIKVISNKVIIKSEMKVCTLYSLESDNKIEFMENAIPFTEIIDVQGIREDMQVSTMMQVKDVHIASERDADGDMRIIVCDIKIDISIKAYEQSNLQVLTDVYSTVSEMEVEKQYIGIQENIIGANAQSTIREVILPPDDVPGIERIYNVVAKPYVSDCRVGGGKAEIDGAVDVYVLYLSNRDDYPVYSFKQEIPFIVTADLASNVEGEATANAEVNHISYNLNSAGEIEVRIIVGCDIAIAKVEQIEIVSNIEELPAAEKKRASVIMYFVQRDDDLWEIAKRYKTSISGIVNANSIKENESLDPGKLLLIPNK